MEKVRCKMVCRSILIQSDNQGGTMETVDMSAVTDGSEENIKFFKWTPTGELKLQTINPGMFETGREYMLDFTICDE